MFGPVSIGCKSVRSGLAIREALAAIVSSGLTSRQPPIASRIEIVFSMPDVTGVMAALSRAKVARFYNPHHERCKKSPLMNPLNRGVGYFDRFVFCGFHSFSYPFKIRLRDKIPWLSDPWAKNNDFI